MKIVNFLFTFAYLATEILTKTITKNPFCIATVLRGVKRNYSNKICDSMKRPKKGNSFDGVTYPPTHNQKVALFKYTDCVWNTKRFALSEISRLQAKNVKIVSGSTPINHKGNYSSVAFHKQPDAGCVDFYAEVCLQGKPIYTICKTTYMKDFDIKKFSLAKSFIANEATVAHVEFGPKKMWGRPTNRLFTLPNYNILRYSHNLYLSISESYIKDDGQKWSGVTFIKITKK